jgi:predicted DNA-binding transcriptional regulator AlpA
LADIHANAEPPQMQTDILKDYISRDDLADKLGKSVKTLVRWELDGKGPPVTRIGRDVLYRIPSVEKWLQAQERAARGATAHAA